MYNGVRNCLCHVYFGVTLGYRNVIKFYPSMSFSVQSLRNRFSALSVLFVLLIVGIFLALSACRSGTMPAEEVSRWVSAYAPAHVDQDSKIRLELTDLLRSQIDSTRSLERVFKFSPRIKGSAVLSADKRFLDFVPAESMKQGRTYNCRVSLKNITGIDSLADFEFDFYVDKREIRFDDVVATVDPDNAAMMSVQGRLVYNVAAGDSITRDSSIIVCDKEGVSVAMSRIADNQSRGFKISGIKRQSKAGHLTLSVNPIGGFATAECEIDIPSVSDFTLLNAERVEAADPYINLEFSSPLSSQQELDGLINIDGLDDVRIERSGTNVKVFYANNGITDLTLRISDMLKNNDGRCLDESIEKHFAQTVIPPAVKIPFQGTILPDNRNLKLPFQAVNLGAVDVEVVKIFPSNVMSFLQSNDMEDTWSLRRYGRLVYHKTVRLDKDKSLDLHKWQDFSIDFKNLFVQERGAVYNIRLTFRKAYSLYGRDKVGDFEGVDGLTDRDKAVWDKPDAYIYREAPDYYSRSGYKWAEADDPSKDSYYMHAWSRMPEVNLVASNLGLIVKRADDSRVAAFVTDIMSASPVGGVNVTAYNYQLQKIGWAKTDENGFAEFKTQSNPFMVTASDGVNTTYLKVTSGRELSTSNFDVSGKSTPGGIKGFAYGERGVWRPGDDIHLTLIVEDKDKRLPDNHPVEMELYNPNEQLYSRQTLTKGVDGFYVFRIPTEESVPTGLWRADFKVGNETIHHPVRIETIKPNRLKINIKAPKVIQAATKARIGLDAHWLTGPVAKGLSASMEMTLFTNPTPFANYKNYTFRNPLITYSSTQKDLFYGTLDSIGSIVRDCTINADVNTPGMLQANITAKVTEPGGDASIATTSVPFSPFGVYVGIDPGQKTFETDTNIQFPVVVLNRDGARLKTRELDYKIYRLDWDWWWEGSAEDLSRYVQSTTVDVVANGTITVTNGKGSIPFRVDYPEWGRYLILVRDTKGGHATGGLFTVDWPEWRGRSNREGASGSNELSFVLDKPQYEVGETANVYLPKCAGGKVLLSIENGSKMVKTMWVPLSAANETKYPLRIDKEMAPNFYVSATLLRPHKTTDFGTPVRLFGVQSAKVVNPRSILHPIIDMPDELHPQKPFTVKVREQERKPMTYTLAIVDEGLLDITNFRTPRPWVAMNQKEALGIRTWDMFNDIIGAFGANFRPVLSVGGDEALRKAAGKEKRFNPVVKFMGPFTTRGGVNTHRIMLPGYVGSVRVMVVAAHDGSYGHADKTVKVTSPVMVLSSLPRELANCDSVDMPVNVFAMGADIKNVAVNIESAGPVKIAGAKSQAAAFDAPGEKIVKFRLYCDREKTGMARIILTASGNGHVCKDTTYINVSNPMPILAETFEKSLAGGKSAEFTWPTDCTEEVSLQIASVPILNFNSVRLFMDNYPHLCSEQLSSKALFMLYGRTFADSEARRQCEHQLPGIIKLLQSRQLGNGGFVYWPRETTENEWVTSMAGLALCEASRQGFSIDSNCLERWKQFQINKSRDYRHSTLTDLTQAFRLYTLAIARTPQPSAMNRLRESKTLSQTAAYCLASAYAETGRKDVALKLIERAERTEATAAGDMFNSLTRNSAFELDAYVLCGQTPKALKTARRIADACSGGKYVTQDIAFASVAFNRLIALWGRHQLSVKVAEQGVKPMAISDIACVKDVSLNSASGKVTVENLSAGGSIDLSLLTSYRPAADQRISPSAKGLKLVVKYTDLKGKPLSVAKLKQDAEFRAVISVTNYSDDVENMALTYAIPSGWEIWNSRLYGGTGADCDNSDIRDKSVNLYFGLKKGAVKTFNIRLRAAYVGNYLLPPTVCEDMYDSSCRAMTANRRVCVVGI